MINRVMLNIVCYLINMWRIFKACFTNQTTVELYVLPVRKKDEKSDH